MTKTKRFFLLSTIYYLVSSILFVPKVQAVDIGQTYLGAYFQTFGELVSTGLNFIFGLAFTLTFFLVLFGGIRLLTSGGDEKAVASAKGLITSALIGLGLVFVSYWIVRVIEKITGLEGAGIFL